MSSLFDMTIAIPADRGRSAGCILRLALVSPNPSPALCLRHHFEVMFLPPYSPDYNPIERLWLRLKSEWFTDFIADSTRELSDRLVKAIQSIIQDPEKIGSVCAFRK